MSETSKVIGDKSQVIMHFDLKLADGSAADSTRVNKKPARLVMGDGSLTPNFEACLLGLSAGDKKSFELAPEDAFGQPNPDNVHHMDKSRFAADMTLEEGMIMAFANPMAVKCRGLFAASPEPR